MPSSTAPCRRPTAGDTDKMLYLILLVFAFVLATVEALWPTWASRTRPHLGWLALALYFLALILGHGMALR